MFQPYLTCCFDNISRPLFYFAKSLGVTELVYGQRSDESHKSPARNGVVVDGIVRTHPIESWTTTDVLSYLETKMDVPWHFKNIEHTSLDCYDCVAYRSHSADRVRWTQANHPELYAAYDVRRRLIDSTLVEALKEH